MLLLGMGAVVHLEQSCKQNSFITQFLLEKQVRRDVQTQPGFEKAVASASCPLITLFFDRTDR